MRLLLAAIPLTLAAVPAAAQLPDSATTHSEAIPSPGDQRDWSSAPLPPSSDARPQTPATPWEKPFRKFDWNRPESGKAGYFADDYHTAWIGDNGTRLRQNDRVYRGRDLNYYCRRWDGGTQQIDPRGSALLGNALAPGGSAKLRAIAGAELLAALARREIRCGGQFSRLSMVDIHRGPEPATEAARVRNLKD